MQWLIFKLFFYRFANIQAALLVCLSKKSCPSCTSACDEAYFNTSNNPPSVACLRLHS